MFFYLHYESVSYVLGVSVSVVHYETCSSHSYNLVCLFLRWLDCSITFVYGTKLLKAVILTDWNRWGADKFPNETPLVFYQRGKPIDPPLGIIDGLEVVLNSMISYIEKEVPEKTLKFWRTQSPRHFFGGEWDHNGSCLFSEPLKETEVYMLIKSCSKLWKIHCG